MLSSVLVKILRGAQAGYAIAAQNVRGRCVSEGTFNAHCLEELAIARASLVLTRL